MKHRICQTHSYRPSLQRVQQSKVPSLTLHRHPSLLLSHRANSRAVVRTSRRLRLLPRRLLPLTAARIVTYHVVRRKVTTIVLRLLHPPRPLLPNRLCSELACPWQAGTSPSVTIRRIRLTRVTLRLRQLPFERFRAPLPRNSRDMRAGNRPRFSMMYRALRRCHPHSHSPMPHQVLARLLHQPSAVVTSASPARACLICPWMRTRLTRIFSIRSLGRPLCFRSAERRRIHRVLLFRQRLRRTLSQPLLPRATMQVRCSKTRPALTSFLLRRSGHNLYL